MPKRFFLYIKSVSREPEKEQKIKKYLSTYVNFIDLLRSQNKASQDRLNLGWAAVFPPSENGAASVTYHFVRRLLRRQDINLYAIAVGARIDKTLFPGIKFTSWQDPSLDVVIFWCLGHLLEKVRSKARKIIWQTMHDPLNQVMERKIFDAIKQLSPDLVITLSEWSKNEYSKNGLKNVAYIPAGVDRQLFKPRKDKARFKVLFVSRANRFKGLIPFLESIALVVDKHPEVIFSLHAPLDKNPTYIRETPLDSIKKVHSRYPNNFEYDFNWVDYGLIADKYRDASVLVFPSNCEGFGVPLIEAMACGIPCIVLDKPPMNEIIQDNQTGYCLPFRTETRQRYESVISRKSYHYEDYRDWLFNHPEDIADRICYLVEHPDEYKRLSENAVQAARYYDLDACVEKMVHYAKEISGRCLQATANRK